MSGLLEQDGNGGGYAHCRHCGRLATGPCARCQAPVCGDCCVLTEGGASVYAICLGCEELAGRSLKRGWLRVISWFIVPIVVLLVVVAVLSFIRRAFFGATE